MSKKSTVKSVHQINPESRESCACPVCQKRAMDILNGGEVELKCPHCGIFVTIPLDKKKKALKVAERRTRYVY